MVNEPRTERMSITNFKDLTERSPYGEQLQEAMSAFVPLALQLPQLRDNPSMLQENVKTNSVSGITDVATQADLYMQDQLKNSLINTHSDWQFWGEEGADNVKEIDASKKFLVVTDPIEGTNNFKTRKDDQWGSVVALVDTTTGEPVIGIIALPTKRRFYVGVKDMGAYVVEYDEQEQIKTFEEMPKEPEFSEFTYNASPHFEPDLVSQVDRFIAQGEVEPDNPNVDVLENSRKKVVMSDGNIFIDPESGVLEVVRNRGTIYFKTSNEMAAVFTVLSESGGKITDGEGKPWRMGINTLIAARNEDDYEYLKNLYDRTRNPRSRFELKRS